MYSITNFVFIFVLFLCPKIILTTDVCANLGFNSLVLKCETCKDLQRVVADAELYDDCLNCCLKNSDSDLFSKVVFEVDQRFVSSFVNVDSIIKLIKELRNIKSNKEHIKLRYTFGSMPKMLVYKDVNDESPTETIQLQGWSKDDFSDYLKSHIKNINLETSKS